MIKFRLTGSQEEIEAALRLLKRNFYIKEVSQLQKNRNSIYYRVYATVMILEDNNE